MSPTTELPVETVAEEDVPQRAHLVEDKTSEQRLYTYSAWVHVGPGAENCEAIDEEAGMCECSNPLHFHGWCRLPNQFQHREIREKALAAKARRSRQLRDPETDGYAILEDELEAMTREGDAIKETLIDEIMSRDWWRDFTTAGQEAREKVFDEDETPRFEHIDNDQRRYIELDAMDEEDRKANGHEDEHGELERHLQAYNEVVDERQNELSKPRREALAARDLDDLIAMVRDYRIDGTSTESFAHVYAINEWLSCTFVARGVEQRKFTSLGHLEAVAPEVLVAIKECFEDLENAHQREGEEGKVSS